MGETETKAKVLMGLGIIGALLPIALEVYFRVADNMLFGTLSAFPLVQFVLPIYILGLIVRKDWGFYVAFLVLLAHFLLYFFSVFILQHTIYFLEYRPLPFWRFEVRLLQLTWSWMLSVLLMFLGIAGNSMLLKIRYGFKAFDKTRVVIKGKVIPLGEILVVVAIIALMMGIMMPALNKTRHTVEMECAANLERLRSAVQLYAEQFDGVYPTPNKWCDLLLEGNCLKSKRIFKCPAVRAGRCHFAINPDCSPNSPNDVVLLFETKGGWNQYGGPELITYDNHKGKNAFVLFNSGFINFINSKEADQLKWKPEETQEE
jgi:competence protein ComGC